MYYYARSRTRSPHPHPPPPTLGGVTHAAVFDPRIYTSAASASVVSRRGRALGGGGGGCRDGEEHADIYYQIYAYTRVSVCVCV